MLRGDGVDGIHEYRRLGHCLVGLLRRGGVDRGVCPGLPHGVFWQKGGVKGVRDV